MSRRSTATTRFAVSLLSGAALLALATPAFAQTAPAPADTSPEAGAQDDTIPEDIVVTGSSIRGVPPTGSNLIQVGAEEVVNTGASTTQELLATIPQLSTFNTAPRPDQRSNGIISTAPNIRGIGQAQTLVLINGHRLVGVGHLQNIPDPSIIPTSGVQRIEVVADGASSVYGSDGIAGVVNVITRKDYNGLEGTFRVGYGDSYNTMNANAVAGTKWDGGGVMIAGEYSKTSRLRAVDRDYLTQDFTAAGGRDNRATGNACLSPTYRVNTTATGGPTGNFIQPATGAVSPRCDNIRDLDLYPRQERLSFLAAGHHQAADNVELFFDAFYSRTQTDAYRESLYTTNVMTRNNPFFPTFVDPAVPSISVTYNVNALDGVRERDTQDLSVYGGTVGAGVDFGRFKWTTYVTGSRSSTDLREGSFSPVAAGALIQSSSAATAIDPFGGRTSQQTKITLADWEQSYRSKQYIWEVNTKVDGPLFALPGGDVKIAVGGVHRQEFFDGLFTNGRINALEGVGAQKGLRKVWSGFGELFVPIFGADNATGGFQRLDLSLSARHDSYSDFGSTTNPKVGVNWEPLKGFTLRGSFGTSFHAPALPDLYGPDTRAGYLNNGLAPPGFQSADVPGGIFIAGGNPNLDAEKATTWSLGVDFQPTFLPGFKASATYYNVKFKGRVAFPSSSFFYRDPAFNQFFVSNNVCTTGTYNPASPDTVNCRPQPIPSAQVWAIVKDLPLQNFPTTVTGPSDLPPIYSITILRRANLAEIDTDGIDFDLNYRWNMGERVQMSASVSGNYVLSYDQKAIEGALPIDQFPFGQAKFRVRGQLGAVAGPVTAVAMLNYSDKYKNQYFLPTNVQATETIGAYTTLDLHFGYKLPAVGVLEGTELVLDVDNLFDADPPFARAGNGYGNGNVLGRVFTFGVRKKF